MLKAVELFSRKGYEGISVGEITEASKITKPTLYYYFGSKEGLFEAVCQSHYARLNSLLTENAVYISNPKIYDKDIDKSCLRLFFLCPFKRVFFQNIIG